MDRRREKYKKKWIDWFVCAPACLDPRYIELLNRIEVARRAPNPNDKLFLADILAFQGPLRASQP